MKNRSNFIVCIVVTLLVFTGCKSNDGARNDQSKNLVSIVSIGKVVDIDSYDQVLITLRVGGVSQNFYGNEQLIKNILKPGQVVSVGASISDKGVLVAKSIEGDPNCPYVTKSLTPGVNHVSLTFCSVKKDEGEDENDKAHTEKDDSVKDPNHDVDVEVDPKL